MQLFFRILLLLLCFAAFSLPVTFVGTPESPAYQKIRSTQEKHLDFVVIGDSRGHTGISPTQLSASFYQSTGKTISGYNFSVDGTDVLHHFSFAKNGLGELKQKPKVVLWTPNPLHFNEGRNSNRLEQLKATDILPMAQAGAPVELLLDLATMSFFKPWQHKPMVTLKLSEYSERAGLRTLPLQRKIFKLDYQKELVSREYTPLDDGQEPFTVLEWKDRFQRGANAYVADYAKLTISPWRLTLAAKLISELNKQGITVVILEMPVAPWFQTHLANSQKHLEWRKSLQKVANQNGAIFLDHSALMDGNDIAYGDPGHMPRETATRYSQKLGKILAEMHLFQAQEGK